MEFTPAHIAVARGRRTYHITPQELIRVRKLYLEKRYKQCIAASEELLEPPPLTPVTPACASKARNELHPVHQAFLTFHQAISYESMGLAAHKYSRNKLRLLESAKENLDAAIIVLPQPFANAEDGRYQTPHADSPDLYHHNDDASHYGDESPSIGAGSSSDGVDSASVNGLSWANVIDANGHAQPTDDLAQPRIVSEAASTQVSHRTRSPSEESFVSNTTATTIPQVYTVSDFSKYSPRQDPIEQYVEPSPPETPQPPKLGRILLRSVPLVKIDSIELGSSDDESEPDHPQSGWLPRSMRSLNLAAYNLSSDDDSDEEEATPSKQSAAVPRATRTEPALLPPAAPTSVTAAMDSLQSPPSASSSYTFRLSASLSSQHMLSENLVPSPLFSNNKKKKVGAIGLDEEEFKPAPRPLPPTPHSFHSHLHMLPARKTAVQTLISKFEGALPLPHTPSSYTTATPRGSDFSGMTLQTPATLRFDMIHDAFDASPDETHLKAYLTSRSLANYNSHLASFRTCLVTASDRMTDHLEAAQALQQQHEEDKQTAALRDQADGLPKNRLASMWLLSTPGKAAPGALKSRNGIRRDREQEIASPTPRAKIREKVPLRNRVEELEEKRAERIRKLRACGFRVNKERYGWKGDDYYEGFRRNVEIELGA